MCPLENTGRYRVFCNETELQVKPIRTSAVPFNRVWTGKQRDLSQTEISYFVSADGEFPMQMKIKVSETVEAADIRPVECAIPFEVKENTVFLTLSAPQNFVLEINGYGRALHIFANRPCKSYDGDVIYFGKGEHREGIIELRDNQTLFIDSGAEVYGSVFAKNAKNVKIVGHGVLNSCDVLRGNQLSPDDEYYKRLAAMGLTERDIIYSSSVNIYGCENVLIDGITIVDSPLWSLITRNNCRGLTITNVKIVGQWRYNADGMDICSCRDVRIENCFVRSFDDCIVMRSAFLDGEEGGCENVTVSDCVLWCDWGKAVKIWMGDKPACTKNVVFSDIHVIRPCAFVAGVETRFGAENITVESCAFRNFTTDLRGKRLYPMLQGQDDDVYIDYGKDFLGAIYISVYNLGKNLGNQQFDGSVDTSGYKIYYRDIDFESFSYIGGKKPPNVIETADLTQYENIRFDESTD